MLALACHLSRSCRTDEEEIVVREVGRSRELRGLEVIREAEQPHREHDIDPMDQVALFESVCASDRW